MSLEIAFWGLLILANIHLANDKNDNALPYIVLACGVLVINIVSKILV